MGNRNSSSDPDKGNEQQQQQQQQGRRRGSSGGLEENLSGNWNDEQERRSSYWSLIKGGYNEMVNAIIRPPRADYTIDMLGPTNFAMENVAYMREDLELFNDRGQRLVCSHWGPRPEFRRAERLPCLVYLHGNASCRAEALDCIRIVLSAGITLFALDMTGSGHSDGEYISLGWYEREDVHTVVEYLRNTNKVSTIGLWGRSMGAVTALLHGDRDPSIACMILDSPFASLRQLARELVDHAQLNVPKFAIGLAIKMVRQSVKSRAGFDINKLEPIAHADRCFIPALFGAAEHDLFIRPHHSRQIHEVYAGDKNLITFDGDHNSQRPSFFYSSVAIFLHNTMVEPFEAELGGHGLVPAPSPSNVGGAPENFGQIPHFDMPAPLGSGGGGIGIGVGTPQQVAASRAAGPDGDDQDDDVDEYEMAMLRHAIELSLAEENARENANDAGDFDDDEDEDEDENNGTRTTTTTNDDAQPHSAAANPPNLPPS